MIYILQGTSGNYEERYEWIVCAYQDRAAATAHTKKAQCRACRIECACKLWRELRLGTARERTTFFDDWGNFVGENSYDPNMIIGFTPIRYFVTECPYYAYSSGV